MRIAVIADSPRQRIALVDTVQELGLNVVACLDSHQAMTNPLRPADVWLVDVDNYDVPIEVKIDQMKPKTVIIGFSSAPYMSDGAYDKWQRKMMRKLGKILHIEHTKPFRKRSSPSKWRYVVFMGASMGGPKAVKEFLDSLSPNLPISIILAHHFDSAMIDTLPKVLTHHNNWRCKVIDTTQRLQAGTCLVAPIDRQIVCDSTGRVILTKKPWEGEYRPNIGSLLKNASDVYGQDLIAIIFSGMGDDGSQHVKEIGVNHSQLWAQDPTTCQSPSQPQAFIDTGFCQFVGSPKVMATRLGQLVQSHSNLMEIL